MTASSMDAAARKVVGLLNRSDPRRAAQEAERALRRTPRSPQLWSLLGAARLMVGDPAGGLRATAKALELDPHLLDAQQNHAVAVERLDRRCRETLGQMADPEDEGGRLEAAYRVVVEADELGALAEDLIGPALAVLERIGAAEEADRRWPFAETGRGFAARAEHRSLIYQIPRVKTDADRRELLEEYRSWGRAVEARAAVRPIRPAAHAPRSRLRLGLLSSDLRIHVVTAFADPLIEHGPENDVDIYCYSAQPGPPDAAQTHIAGRVAGFRHLPGASAEAVAEAVAADAPDILIEIGGSTNANRLEVMAHRLAPVQASWMGYPHSAGLSTIDNIVVDPYLVPPDRSLLVERPLIAARSWICMSPGFFRQEPQPAAEPPEVRKGWVTFGSANSTYKYAPAMLQAWARVLASVPDSRFLFVRPEGGSPTFRRNMAEAFAREGVSADRLQFAAVRGGHLPYYGEIDVALDTFPLTGGTTTCEALWMGAPVVSLAGPALYERLSRSILHNAGLGSLCADDVETYVATAVEVAKDRAFRRRWRAECRESIMGGPLGDLPGFAREFFDLFKRVA